MKETLQLELESGEVLARLVQEDGETRIDFAKPSIEKDISKLVERGLHEWVGTEEDILHRVTLSSDPEFLPRLSKYLKRSYNLNATTSTV